MEEDVLKELKIHCNRNKLKFEKILWLRPTHPLRCKKTFNQAYRKFIKYKQSVLITHKEEPRLFYEKKNNLHPLLGVMKKRSMVRGQEVKNFYSIFSGEFFEIGKQINKLFLGKKIKFVVAPKLTKVDIDTKLDLKIVNNTVKKNKKYFKNYIHV